MIQQCRGASLQRQQVEEAKWMSNSLFAVGMRILCFMIAVRMARLAI